LSLGLELPGFGLGFGLGFYDKVSVSVSSRNLSQVLVSVSEVTVSTTSLISIFSAKHTTDLGIYVCVQYSRFMQYKDPVLDF